MASAPLGFDQVHAQVGGAWHHVGEQYREGAMTEFEPTIPHNPRDVSSEDRGWAAAAHLLPFIGLSFIGPLVIWLIKRDESPYVEGHAREALNFQISLIIYGIVSGILIIVLIGILMLIALFLFALIFMIIAGVKGATGEPYRYPLTIRFIGEPTPTVG